jgi:hypothetical protein
VLQHIELQHPPDEEYRNNRPCDMNDPVSQGLRFTEVEHDGIVAWADANRFTPVLTFLFRPFKKPSHYDHLRLGFARQLAVARPAHAARS